MSSTENSTFPPSSHMDKSRIMEEKSKGNRPSETAPADSQLEARGVHLKIVNSIKKRRQGFSKSGNNKSIFQRIPWGMASELLLIGLWALWAGRNYLDFNTFAWPNGREFGAQVQTHYFWTQLSRCGICALWNGSINGGYPALSDVFGSTLHPLIAVTTLLWGVVNGAKVAVVLSLAIAGFAQWWIANTLRLGKVARVWTALIAIVSGHLTGRLETPVLGIVYSTAMASLTLAAALNLGIHGRRRMTIILALAGAVTIVSGQGYMQLGILVWTPAFLFFILNNKLKLRPVWREFAIAIGLSLLLVGVFIIPALHFWPKIVKAGDVDFKAAQPLEYIPLNLFIRDTDFFRGTLLGKLPFPALYNLYIGWTPVILAILCLVFARRKDLSALLCLTSGILLMFFLASAIPLGWLIKTFPILSGFRHTPLFAGLAIPALLGLAGYGLDRLLNLNWPQATLRFHLNAPELSWNFNLAWLLVIPLIWSLRTVYDLSQNWFITADSQPIYESMTHFKTSSLQWVTFPFGEHYWIEPAQQEGLKVTTVVWAWDWIDHELPKPRLEANRGEAPAGTEVVGEAGGVPIYLHRNNEYAFIDLGGQVVPCVASGSGGDLTVDCSTDAPGQLIVKENSWGGWLVWLDGERASLLPSQWLSTKAPSGRHVYRFRYIPLDVAFGLILTLIGVTLAIWFWQRSPKYSSEDAEPKDT